MSVFETSSKSGFLKRDENAQAKNNLLLKVQQLEEFLGRLDKQLRTLQLECSSVRQEKQTVEVFLAKKSEQTKQNMLAQLAALQQEMLRNVEDNSQESRVLLDRIARLKDVQLGCQKSILGLQRRIHELEVQIGM